MKKAVDSMDGTEKHYEEWENKLSKLGSELTSTNRLLAIHKDRVQSLENSYFEKEYKYIKAAGKKKTDFSAENKSLFFLKKTDKERIIQAYRCLSYHLYFDFLSLDSIE